MKLQELEITSKITNQVLLQSTIHYREIQTSSVKKGIYFGRLNGYNIQTHLLLYYSCIRIRMCIYYVDTLHAQVPIKDCKLNFFFN